MNLVYQIIILPIESLIEYIFCFCMSNFTAIGVPGTLVVMSLVVNLLALPLYNIADKLQLKEREIQNKMSYRVERIKKGFKGDEQFMILQEYYRQNGYHPLYALRSALSILIEVPFFIAGYHFLSNCTYLDGVGFSFIKDLGKPDQISTLYFAGKAVVINILPIVMTLINLVSAAVYTKGAKIREKLQTIILALIFLFLLYFSPSGLVIYWICNNLFSLVKNIVLVNATSKDNESTLVQKNDFTIFILSSIGMFLLAGVVISSNAIVTSPVDFSLVGQVKSPNEFILTNASYFFGLLVVWPFVIYKMFDYNVKKAMEIIFSCAFPVVLANVFIFKHAYGTINNTFSLDKPEYLKNNSLFLIIGPIVFLIVVFCIVILVSRAGKNILVCYIFASIIIAEIFVGAINCRKINSSYKSFLSETGIDPDYEEVLEDDDMNLEMFKLSKTENNVLVLFIDRALSNYFPYVIEQFPELNEAYSGFKYYPNCLSFSDWTSCAGPAMFGGYEYTVDAMDERDDMLLKDKFNEAQRVMPKLFSDEGYDVSMANVPFPNFNEGEDPLGYVFNGMENVDAFDIPYKVEKRYHVEYADDIENSNADQLVKVKCRNFSGMQMMFPILRNYVFNGSSYYYDSNRYPALAEFMEGSYAQLLYLPEMFSYDSDKPTFTMIANDFAHDYTILREDYSFGTIDGKHKAAGTGTRSQQKGPYHVNTAVYLKLAQFFETMKEKGVYDNTRIIIVSDHGYAIDVPAFEQYDNGKDMASFNPVMLVKDYNTTGKPVTDYKLVTNADLVNFAREGIISSDRNPYTGNTFMSSDDFDSFNVYRMDNWWTEDYQKEYRYPIKDKVAYTVTDNIFDPDNWKRIDTSVIKE